jgi:hypothetical protein
MATSTPAKRKAPSVTAPAAAAKPMKKPKLVRDGFTMPESDHALIATLKARALKSGRETKKSELLRAGLQALAGLDAKTLIAALARLEPIKIGRPRNGG